MKSITSSWVAGNRGSDTLSLGGATTILNSTILGSDLGGTISGNDSLSAEPPPFKPLRFMAVPAMTPALWWY